jgi:hypothetical protein
MRRPCVERWCVAVEVADIGREMRLRLAVESDHRKEGASDGFEEWGERTTEMSAGRAWLIRHHRVAGIAFRELCEL